MEKKIIIDDQNVFSFDGKKLKPLGKSCEMKDIWQGKIFTVEKKLYAKKGDEFSLLVENFDKVYEAEMVKPAQRQFELVGDVLVMIDNGVSGIRKLSKTYAPYLDRTLSWKEKPILFVKREKDDEYEVLVVIEDENGNIRLSEQKAFRFWALASVLVLCWNCKIYRCASQRNTFYLSSLRLLFEGDNYLVFAEDCGDNASCTAIAIDKNGKMTPLGVDSELKKTQNATLLESSDGIYHLKQDEFSCVIKACYSGVSFIICEDGTICYVYKSIFPDGSIAFCHDLYHLVDGNYKFDR